MYNKIIKYKEALILNIEKTIKNLEKRGFKVSFHENGSAAAEYLCSSIKDCSVGIGGSVTAGQLKLYELLSFLRNMPLTEQSHHKEDEA